MKQEESITSRGTNIVPLLTDSELFAKYLVLEIV
jgi:hypothetical protein